MRSLTWKIALPIMASIWILFTLAGYMSYQTRRRSIEEIKQAEVHNSLMIAAHALRLIMLTEPAEHARTFLTNIMQELKWYQLEAISPDGKHRVIVRSTEVTGQRLPSFLQVQYPLPYERSCLKCHQAAEEVNAGRLMALVDLEPIIRPIRRRYYRFLIVHLLASLLLAFIVHQSIVHWVQKPLHGMIRAMENVAQGNFNVKLEAKGKDEIATLTHHFSSMVRELQKFQEMKERHQQLKLRQAQHLATVGEMAASLAHEIKNPLAGVSSALSIIHEQGLLAPQAEEIYQTMQEDLRRINRVLEDLLLYARPRPMEQQQVDLREIVTSIVSRLGPRAQSQSCQLITRIIDDNVKVWGDPNQLHQLVYNLCLNALDAVGEDGYVEIGVRRVPGTEEIELWVEDNGPGIDPEQREKIFRPFYSTKLHGTGLGLPICMRIVEGHGGRLTVQSEPGRGARFIVYLPIKSEVIPMEQDA